MTSQRAEYPTSIWSKDMELGVPAFDVERRDLARLIEVLGQGPFHKIRNENFLGRFHTFQVVVQEYFAREDSLMELLGIPATVIADHAEEHNRIVGVMLEVYIDSIKQKPRSPCEIYQMIREVMSEHMLIADAQLRAHLP